MIPQIRILRHNQNLLRYLRQVIWRRKWTFAMLMLTGGILSLLIIYLKPPKHVAQATFVADLPLVVAQLERMGSRDLIARSIDDLELVKVEYFNKGWFGRRTNLYNQTPVVLYIESFPEHLEDVEMKLAFSEDGNYKLSFDALGDHLEGDGVPGERLTIGSISLVLEPTRFWSPRKYGGNEIYFRVRKPWLLANEIAKSYKVEHFLISRNRIVIRYADLSHDRARDILRAVANNIMRDHELRNLKKVNNRISNMRNRMRVLLEGMQGNTEIGQLLRGQNIAGTNQSIDSLVLRLEAETFQKERLLLRDSLLRNLKHNNYIDPDFLSLFPAEKENATDDRLVKAMDRRAALLGDDSKPADLAEFRALNIEIQEAWSGVLEADSAALEASTLRREKLEDALMTNLSVRDAVVREVIRHRDENLEKILQWEEFLNLAEKSYTAEFETYTELPAFEMVESPYVIAPNRQWMQIVRFVTGVLLGALLALFFSLVAAFGGGNVSSSQHLELLAGMEVVSTLKSGSMAHTVRELQVAIEMNRETDEKIISVVGGVFLPHCHEVVRGLAEKYSSSGRKVLIRNDNQESDDKSDPGTMAAGLLSQKRQDKLVKRSEEFDIVLQHLLPLRSFPESWYQIKPHRHLIYFVHSGETTQAEIRTLEKMAEDASIQIYIVFDRT